ncbi:arsenate reductase/protein-tyrosine-phosphatase family protein [Streptomyces wedmorensis]
MTASSHPVLPDERLAAGVARLAVRHQGRYSMETAQRLIADSYEQLAENAHVRTHPSGAVDPHVLQALTEVGAALDEVCPKPLTDEVVQAADIVITMGCGDACPVVPGHRYLDRPVPDPDGAPIAVVRSVRDAIDARITTLLDTLPST